MTSANTFPSSITEPMDLQPGDAAAHAMYTLRDAPANQGDRPPRSSQPAPSPEPAPSAR